MGLPPPCPPTPTPPPVWKEFFSWMLEAVEGNDHIVIWPGLCKSARLLVFLPVLVVGRQSAQVPLQ